MFIVLLLQDVHQKSDGSIHSLGPATAPLPRAHATEASDLSAAPPCTVPVSLSPWKTVAPRPAFLPSGQDVTKVSQLMAVIASTQPAWEAGASCSGEMGMGHRGAFLTLLSLPLGQEWRNVKEKGPPS